MVTPRVGVRRFGPRYRPSWRALYAGYREVEPFQGTDGTAFTNVMGISDGGGDGTGTWKFLNAYTIGSFQGSIIDCTSASVFSRQINFIPKSVSSTCLTLTFSLSVMPTANMTILYVRNAATTVMAELQITTAAVVRMRNNSIATGTTGTTTLATNTQYQVMWYFTHDGSGQMAWRLYDASGTLLETRTNGSYTGGGVVDWNYGIASTPGTATQMKLARPAVDTGGWIDPIVAVAAPLTGTAAGGAVDGAGGASSAVFGLVGTVGGGEADAKGGAQDGAIGVVATASGGQATAAGGASSGAPSIQGTISGGQATAGGGASSAVFGLVGAVNGGQAIAGGGASTGTTGLVGTVAGGQATVKGGASSGGIQLPGTASGGQATAQGGAASAVFGLVGLVGGGQASGKGGASSGVTGLVGLTQGGQGTVKGGASTGGIQFVGLTQGGQATAGGGSSAGLFGLVGLSQGGQGVVRGGAASSAYGLVGVTQGGVIITAGGASVGALPINGFAVGGQATVSGGGAVGTFAAPAAPYAGWGVRL